MSLVTLLPDAASSVKRQRTDTPHTKDRPQGIITGQGYALGEHLALSQSKCYPQTAKPSVSMTIHGGDSLFTKNDQHGIWETAGIRQGSGHARVFRCIEGLEYDASIAFVGQAVGNLLNFSATRGDQDKTLVGINFAGIGEFTNNGSWEISAGSDVFFFMPSETNVQDILAKNKESNRHNIVPILFSSTESLHPIVNYLRDHMKPGSTKPVDPQAAFDPRLETDIAAKTKPEEKAKRVIASFKLRPNPDSYGYLCNRISEIFEDGHAVPGANHKDLCQQQTEAQLFLHEEFSRKRRHRYVCRALSSAKPGAKFTGAIKGL